MRSVRTLALAGMLLASAATGWAQQSIDYASVSGRVTDPSGAVVPGAAVAARHQQTNLVATAITDRDGRFRFPYLRVGPYEVTVHAGGFGDATRPLTLTAGAAFELPVTLLVGGLDSTVVVNAEATVLEAARSQIAGTVSQAEVQSLPLNGRNFLEVALLIPGVSPTNIASTQLFPETSAVPGISLSINSQRNLSNNFIVDGLSANDDAAGLSGITYGVDAVEQVQVITSSGQAELGRALGGYINVVTRSGTNTFHGTIYDYIRDDRFNASNPLVGDHASDEPVAVRRKPWRPCRVEPHVLLRQRGAAATRSIGADDHRAGQRRSRERAAVGDRLSGDRRWPPASTRTRWIRPTCSARSTTRWAAAISWASGTASTT